jgi:iron complex outermembrane receptor protein
MKRLSALLVGTASLISMGSLAVASPAAAQGAPAAAPADDTATLGEIVVTARRRAESLQEVPQTVNAVTTDTLQKLNITQFADVQNVVPGLQLQNRSDGYSQAASMRGVTFDVNTAAPLPTVAMYVNDAAVQAGFVFNSLFDVGQIEVLRGPQGTTRGVSTPSGAMTVTTHRPDLSSFGGYVDGTVSDMHTRNVQGALNIPVIKDVLAVRVAAFYDENDGDGTRSIHNALRQSIKTSAERFSVSFEPSDAFNANLMYQHTDRQIHAFDPVSGPGHVFPATGPVQFVDPPLDPFDRAAVEDGISDARIHTDLVTAQIDSRIFGQHLSYVGSYSHNKTFAPKNLGVTSISDTADILPGIELYNSQIVFSEYTTQEFRLASDPAPGRFFDYVVGGYYSWTAVGGPVYQPPIPAQGAFGPPGAPPDIAAYDPRYTLGFGIANIPYTKQETSLFGNVTLHLPFDTELSGGIRHIWTVFNSNGSLDIGQQTLPLPASLFGGVCGAGGTVASKYAGFCDLTLPSNLIHSPFRSSDTPNIYQVSLSHHFTRDLLGYVNTGTSYRPAYASFGITNAAVLTSTDPLIQALVAHPAERSRSYELGFKWTFLDGRARINADVYRQRFTNFTIVTPYTQIQGGAPFNFTAPADALVKGIELDAAWQVTRDWNIGLLYSYSDGAIQGSLIPCNLTDASGAPVFNHPPLSFCQGGTASRSPYWNATLTSEYVHPVMDGADGFVRMLFSYYPENKNRVEENFTVPSYGLLNLYLGMRSHDGAWEVTLFAKNALKNETVLDKSPVDYNLNSYLGIPAAQLGYGAYLGSYFPANSGYFPTQVTPRREVGISVHYAWGSR